MLSGSTTAGVFGTANVLKLTDDSKYVAAVATPGGPRYNIVSGTLGEPTGSDPAVAKNHITYGWFYPESGIMLFSGANLRAKIPGGSDHGVTRGAFTNGAVEKTDTSGLVEGSATGSGFTVGAAASQSANE